MDFVVERFKFPASLEQFNVREHARLPGLNVAGGAIDSSVGSANDCAFHRVLVNGLIE
jgi:hypothetical protein